MKGVIVHGALLIAMLLLAYQSWTRDTTVKKSTGSVVLWDEKAGDLQAVVYDTPDRTVKIERRDGYFWGTDTKTTKKPKPKPPVADAGVPTTDGGVPPAPAVDAGVPEAPEVEEVTTVREFPVGEPADELVKGYAAMRALTNLGVLDDAQKAEYKFDQANTLAVVFASGTHTFVVGDKVYMGKDRYLLDVDSGIGYVVAGTLFEPIADGESALKPKKIIPEDDKVSAIEITAGDKSKTVSRITAEDDAGKQLKTWGDAATKKADQTTANFLTKVETALKPSKFDATLDVKALTELVTVTYRDAKGTETGKLTLYKQDNPPPPPDGKPAQPGPDYWVVTTRTRVPALVPKTAGDQVEQQIAGVF